MKLLHSSDIHFGIDNPIYDRKGTYSNKQRMLDELIAFISMLSSDKKSDSIKE